MANPSDNGHHQQQGLSAYEHQQRQEEEDVYGLMSMEAQAAQNTGLTRNTMITIRFQVRRRRLSFAAIPPTRIPTSKHAWSTAWKAAGLHLPQLALHSGHCIILPQCLGCAQSADMSLPSELSMMVSLRS